MPSKPHWFNLPPFFCTEFAGYFLHKKSMKRNCIHLFAVLLLFQIAYPQIPRPFSLADTIVVESGLFHTFRFQAKQIGSSRELKATLSLVDDPASMQFYQKARRWNMAGQITGISGGVLMGYALGSGDWSSPQNRSYFFYGLALAAGSYLLQHRANQQFLNAVNRYNFVLKREFSSLPYAPQNWQFGIGIRF